MKFEIEIKNTENVTNFSSKDIQQVEDILSALISSGGLTGVKSGKTIIHFDEEGVFKRIQFDYYPWIKRSN